MSNGKIFEIDLRSWDSGSPMGAVIYDGDWQDAIDSEYCDSVEDFEEFARRNAEMLDPYFTTIAITVNAGDANATAVLDEGREIASRVARTIE